MKINGNYHEIYTLTSKKVLSFAIIYVNINKVIQLLLIFVLPYFYYQTKDR